MKKISTGGIIVGILEVLIAIGLIAVYVVTSQDVRMERFLDDPSTTFPVLCLLAGCFKLFGVVITWMKVNLGIGIYAIGNLISIYFLFILSADFSFSYSEERLPILILYAGIALQFWFIYIMKNAIKQVEIKTQG